MRKIEAAMLHAVAHCQNWRSGNTEVQAMHAGRIEVYLHGNLIAQRNDWQSAMSYTMAGWPTATTKSRLRALGAPIRTTKGATFVGGRQVTDSEWFHG